MVCSFYLPRIVPRNLFFPTQSPNKVSTLFCTSLCTVFGLSYFPWPTMSTQFPILSSSLATYSPLHGLRMKLLVHSYERLTVSTLSLYFLWIVTRTLLYFSHFLTHPCTSPDQDTFSFRYFLWMAHSFSLPFLEYTGALHCFRALSGLFLPVLYRFWHFGIQCNTVTTQKYSGFSFFM